MKAILGEPWEASSCKGLRMRGFQLPRQLRWGQGRRRRVRKVTRPKGTPGELGSRKDSKCISNYFSCSQGRGFF